MNSSETPNEQQPGSNSESENTEATDSAPQSVEKQLAAAIAERDQCKEMALRANAELENFRKRSQKEVGDMLKYASMGIVRDLLPGLDNLRRALVAAEQSSDINELVQGVSMVLSQFESVLTSHQIKPIAAKGEQFDPNLHEALTQIPSADHPANTIIEEIERGYQMHDRVVRPGKVVVSKEVTDQQG